MLDTEPGFNFVLRTIRLLSLCNHVIECVSIKIILLAGTKQRDHSEWSRRLGYTSQRERVRISYNVVVIIFFFLNAGSDVLVR